MNETLEKISPDKTDGAPIEEPTAHASTIKFETPEADIAVKMGIDRVHLRSWRRHNLTVGLDYETVHKCLCYSSYGVDKALAHYLKGDASLAASGRELLAKPPPPMLEAVVVRPTTHPGILVCTVLGVDGTVSVKVNYSQNWRQHMKLQVTHEHGTIYRCKSRVPRTPGHW